jgi:hypothetical protein
LLIAAPSLVSNTLATLRSCGRGERECVVWWVGPARTPDEVDEVVHPVHLGQMGYYEVDSAWLHTFWVDLGRRRRSIRVQVHTHRSDAFHSMTDDLGAVVQVPGFLSLVLPGFATDDSCLERAFLAELDAKGRFIEVPIRSRILF